VRTTLLIVRGLGLATFAHADLMLGPDHFIGESIKAHGGDKKIDKYRAETMKIEGKMFRDGKEFDLSGEFAVQLPGQMKNVIRFEMDGKKHEIVTVVNGDKGWRRIDGKTEDMDVRALAQARDTLHAYKVARMTQIPNDREFKLVNKNMASNPSMIDGARAWGIQVSYRKEKDVVLWIGDEKKLLLKLERTIESGKMKMVKLEESFSDYKEINGVQRPMKRIVYMDGKKSVESKATELKLLEQLDEKEFAKP
jgi:hypothetical protein